MAQRGTTPYERALARLSQRQRAHIEAALAVAEAETKACRARAVSELEASDGHARVETAQLARARLSAFPRSGIAGSAGDGALEEAERTCGLAKQDRQAALGTAQGALRDAEEALSLARLRAEHAAAALDAARRAVARLRAGDPRSAPRPRER